MDYSDSNKVRSGIAKSSNNGPPQVLFFPDRCVCSTLGYLISQLLCCAPIPTLISHPVDKSQIQLLGRGTLTERSDVSRAFHRGLHQKTVPVALACSHVALREKEAKQEYLVTVMNACYWSDRSTRAARHTLSDNEQRISRTDNRNKFKWHSLD